MKKYLQLSVYPWLVLFRISIILLFLIFSNYGLLLGQDATRKQFIYAKKAGVVSSNSDDLINPNSFNRAVKKDIEFSILGDGSPLAGFAIDVSDEAKAKISGRIPSERGIYTVDLQAGKKKSDIPLFEKGSYTGQAEFSFNYHFIPFKGKYDKLTNSKPAVDAMVNGLFEDANSRSIDTASVLALFVGYGLGQKAYSPITDTRYLNVIAADAALRDHYYERAVREAGRYIKDPGVVDYTSVLALAKELAKIYFTISFTGVTTDRQLKNLVYSATNEQRNTVKLIADFQAVLDRLSKRNELIPDQEIKFANAYWVRKRLRWWTFSLSLNYQAYRMFGRDQDNKILLNESSPFFTPKLTIWRSNYLIFKKFGHLFRLGVEPILGNNLKDFAEVKYFERDTLQDEGNGNVVLSEETTSGLFRNKDSEIKHKLYMNFYGEYYLLPRQNFIPGFSIKLGSLKEGILPGNPRKTRFEFSLVINLLNKESKKALLTIQPYYRFDNLKNEMIKEGDSERPKTGREKSSIGIVIGLPIKGLLALAGD